MGLLNIYDTVSNEHRTIHANGKLKNILPQTDFSHSLVLKAGNRLDGEYEVTEDDVLYVRQIPSGVTAAIVIAVVAIGAAVGSIAYAKNKSDQAKREMEKAQRNAQNMAAAVQQLPFIRGAKNRSALGEAVQYVMGSVYNTPYNITGGFYSIDGTDGVNSYYNATFSAGYDKQKITEVLIGNERIAYNASGISGQQNFDSSSLYYDPNGTNKVEVQQPGDNLTIANCNQKVSSTYSMAELKHDFGADAVPVIVQAAENAMRIQVCIQFSCLRKYNSDAETWQAASATVRPYWSNDGGANWHEFNFTGATNNVFTKNSNKNIRFVAEKVFTTTESYGKNISIKVVKESPKAQSNTQEDCCLLWYQTFQYDAVRSTASNFVPCTPLEPELLNKTTRIAYKIIANETTQNIIDELHAMAEGYARTWNGTSWSSEKTTTRNPASWLLEVLTSEIHAPSKYDTSELKMLSFGALYEYCETNGFHCDAILSQSEKKLDIIEKILNLCNASLIINQEGLLEVCIDKEEQNPVALLNAENIVSFSFSKSLQRKADGSKVTYTNRNSWTVDTFYSMLDGGSYDYANDTVVPLALDYVTEYEHAYKISQRKLRQQQLQPREIKADVGSEGDWYPLYSTILVQIPHLLQGLNSSVIKRINYNNYGEIVSIVISDAVEFVENTRYGVVIQATNDNGFKIYAAEVEGEGLTRTLTFSTPLDTGINSIVPTIGNHLSFGLLDENGRFSKVTHTMKIYGVEPNSKSGFTLTLRDYEEEIYSYGGSIPAYKSNVTRPQAGNNSVSLEEVSRLRQDMNVLQEDLINALQMISIPVIVDADVTNVVVETDSENNVVTAQQIATNISVKQGDEDRPFVIGSINLPSGWSYEVIGNQIVFRIAEGAKIKSGQFKIPVIYRPAVDYEAFVDEDDDNYVDENGNYYTSAEVAGSDYIYDIWFSYFGTSEGVYRGLITRLQDIPSPANIGDYFVWNAADTASTLSFENTFKKARMYIYVGPNKAWQWEADNDPSHTIIAMSDVLGIANADLQNNNSNTWEYLDHLTSNSIYTDMLIANSAFIQQLTAEIISVGSVLTVGNASTVATSGKYSDLTNKPDLKTVATSGKYSDLTNKPDLKTVATSGDYNDLTNKPTIPDVSNLADKDAFAQQLGYSNYADLVAKAASPDFGTLTQNGYLRTSLIDAEAIWTEVLRATSATFEDITVTGNSTFNGTINATAGVFTGQQVINGVFKLNGILQTAFPILKSAFAGLYDVSNTYFEERMVAWIRDINTRKLYLSSSTGNFYFKASGFVGTQYGEGLVLAVRLVMENGALADDKYVLYIWDSGRNLMIEAVRKTWESPYWFEIYWVDPNAAGTWDFNTSSLKKGYSYLSGCISF